jgi:hypothetical protein
MTILLKSCGMFLMWTRFLLQTENTLVQNTVVTRIKRLMRVMLYKRNQTVLDVMLIVK